MSKPELSCDNCGRFVPQLESAQLREADLRAQNAELLAALEAHAEHIAVHDRACCHEVEAEARAVIAQANGQAS